MEELRGDLPTGTVTFLFSDIEESTRLAEKLATATYRDLLEQHHRLLRKAFADNGGKERGTEGDGFLVVFSDAPSAVSAAVEAQRSVHDATWPGQAEVRVRMGLHSGRGIPGGDDYIGTDINRAARVASAAHGGQVLISDATRALSENSLGDDVALRYIGRFGLKGLDAPERLYQLVIDGLPSEFPPPRAADRKAAHLPARMTTFVGREMEISDLRSLLRSGRFVTLVGPGGAGKTTLAIELAREMADEFDDGAWFVDLSTLQDAAGVEAEIASTLGLRDDSRRSTSEILSDHLATREIMLILDNYEHLLASSPVVTRLLADTPDLTVLVTSRSSLDLYGEQIYTVPPLGLPETSTASDFRQFVSSGAVALFVERARAMDPTFSATPDNIALISQICARVDGLPLAIELAASRVRLLSLEAILDRLDQHLPVLAATGTDRPERQRTLEKTIQWSYELMRPHDRELFARLSIFEGGFTLDAAEVICNVDSEVGIDTLEGLASLQRHSLIRATSVGGSTRFDMLETIHDYAAKIMSSAQGVEGLAGRHLEYFTELAEQAESHLMGSGQADWLERLEAEHPNMRKALRFAIDSASIEAGLCLASNLWRFWFERGHLREGRSWLERMLGLEPALPSACRAKAYTALGGLAYWLSDHETTETAYKSALNLYREIGNDEAAAEAMYDYAFAAAMAGDHEEARQRFEASMEAAMEVGSTSLIARNQISFGLAALMEGDPQQAVTLLEGALAVFRQTSDRFNLMWTVGSLGQAYIEMGEIEKGRAAFLESLTLSSEMRNLPVIAAGLKTLAMEESSLGRHVEAMTLMGAAEGLQEATGAASPLPQLVTADMSAARDALGDHAVETALAKGREMEYADAVEYALNVLREP